MSNAFFGETANFDDLQVKDVSVCIDVQWCVFVDSKTECERFKSKSGNIDVTSCLLCVNGVLYSAVSRVFFKCSIEKCSGQDDVANAENTNTQTKTYKWL